MDVGERERSPSELLSAFAAIRDEISKRGLTEDRNGLTGNLAEVYFCHTYKAVRMNERGFDTIVGGKKVQIKGGLRTTSQTGTLLGYDGPAATEIPFDDLAIVMFESDYTVADAVVISMAQVHEMVRVNKRSKAAFVSFSASLWTAGENITDRLRRAAREIDELGYVPHEYRKPKKTTLAMGPSGGVASAYSLIKKRQY